MSQILGLCIIAALTMGVVEVIRYISNYKKPRITQNPVPTTMPTPENTANIAKENAAAQAETANKAEGMAGGPSGQSIQPIILPTPEEVEAARARTKYQAGVLHIAVAGVAGSGKSSLINALRGLSNRDAGAAKTRAVETTFELGRYADPNPRLPIVWYDIPGAGTLRQQDWLYFNTQGLFVFDCIVVLFDNRFTQTDLSILMSCRRLGIPTYIVRSKADLHIANVMHDIMGYESEDDADRSRYRELYETAKHQFVADTRDTVRRNLKDADLPDQRVYILSNKILLSTARKQTPPKSAIDELELVRDLLEEACARLSLSREDKVSATATSTSLKSRE